MKNLEDIMKRLTYLKAESVADSEARVRYSPADREIKSIDEILKIFGVKWHYDYNEDRTRWIAILDSNPT